jgi:hypothetical protein
MNHHTATKPMTISNNQASPHCRNQHAGNRRGLSIMEVLFAIAVLTIGLLGVASILPVATNNASNAIQIDRAIEEINNRIATDIANLDTSFTEVTVANNSLTSVSSNGNARLFGISTTQFRLFLDQYDNSRLPANTLPDAFCIDPWFLTATNNLRDDTGTNPDQTRNGYDRTLFPCYDPRYHPINASPSDQLSASIGSGLITPRFPRIDIPFEGSAGNISAAAAESTTRRSDDFSIVIPDDTTRPPGLFVQRGGNDAGSLDKNTVSSRFSSIVLMSRSETGSNSFDAAVVTMLDRQVVTVPGGGPGLAHNLAPYAAADPEDASAGPPLETQLLYSGEQLGLVSYAQQPFVGGGGGEFIFRTDGHVKPDIQDGDWLMLMRQEFARVGGAYVRTPTVRFHWYQVSSVVEGPTQIGGATGYYQTQIAVRGPDWVFHPIQVRPFPAPFAGICGPPYFDTTQPNGGPQPGWGNGQVFNYDNVPNGTEASFGTSVVLMPDVISVKRFQVQL